ncbi:MAG: flavin reductase family protein [Magnetococcales bacterium]|nr:flavin reductase family protein [Magnetococcales bacterium]
MIIDLITLSPSQIYHVMTQTLIPRPIAWVLSDNGNDSWNLAPFSFFNGLASDPPLLMLSVGLKDDGSPKDTRANILARREFVVHIPPMALLRAMNDSAAPLPAGESELTAQGLEVRPFPGFRLPRVAGCPVAYACRLHQVTAVGDQALIFGEIQSIHLSDRVASRDARGRLKVSAQALDPVARLGAGQYAGLGQVVTL